MAGGCVLYLRVVREPGAAGDVGRGRQLAWSQTLLAASHGVEAKATPVDGQVEAAPEGANPEGGMGGGQG